MDKYLNDSIKSLDISEKTLNILLNNGISNIKDLWKTNRRELKKINLTDTEINNIIIKMQLLGIDLNKKIYRDK